MERGDLPVERGRTLSIMSQLQGWYSTHPARRMSSKHTTVTSPCSSVSVIVLEKAAAQGQRCADEWGERVGVTGGWGLAVAAWLPGNPERSWLGKVPAQAAQRDARSPWGRTIGRQHRLVDQGDRYANNTIRNGAGKGHVLPPIARHLLGHGCHAERLQRGRRREKPGHWGSSNPKAAAAEVEQ